MCGATQIQVLKQIAFVWNGQKTQEGFYCGELVYAWDNCRKWKQFDKYEKREWAEEFEQAIPRKTKTFQLRPESFSGLYSDELVEPKKKQSCLWVSGNKRKYADSSDDEIARLDTELTPSTDQLLTDISEEAHIPN